MKTVFVGGGTGCRDVLEMALQHRLATLSLEILGVMDLDPEAPGMRFAREHGWSTFTDLEEALSVPDLEMVIELTGHDHVRDEIYRMGPPQVRVMDHNMARVFWDLDAIAQHLREELETKTRVTEVIREERARLQALLDSLPDLVMVMDDDGTIRKVNLVCEELTGLSPKAALGRLCFDPGGKTPEATGCERDFCPRLAVL
ncbi:MAG: PAS domain S-box protein, partial [Deltaproteobacteria bacterium]|nr:PAS domain S-box protein [Deltaproteobacteria bacterium]